MALLALGKKTESGGGPELFLTESESKGKKGRKIFKTF